jgi:hypothetical protein
MLQGQNKRLKPHTAAVKLVLACIIFALAAQTTAAASPAAALRDKDVKKAEKILIKLRRLEEASASSVNFRAYKAEMAGLYPGLFVDASELGESDLKTDLTTAVFLYERAYRTGTDSGARITDCNGETRVIYLNLCLEIQERDGSPVRLLWSKARLHTKWAEAVVRSYRGAAGPETLTELSEIEAERKVDITLAERALAALKNLAARVGDYSSGEAFEDAVRAKRISFEQLAREMAEALSTVDQALASLPRGRLYLLLHNARSSYREGLYWWGKTYQLQQKTVSVNNLAAPDPLKVNGLSPGTVNNTVLANWRSALRYTQEVEKAIGTLRA